MNPYKPGWLKEYLEFRQNLPHKEVLLGRHPDESLYRLIQPTGIMYGQPVSAVAHPELDKWSAKSKMKVLLIESMLISANLFHKQDNVQANDDFEIIEKVSNFYLDVYPDLSISRTSFFGRKKNFLELAEKVIDKRINFNFEQEYNFWSRFFNNSLLFVDIYLFGQWIHTDGDKMVVEVLREERTKLYHTVCNVMAAAAHSNKNIEDEERRLFTLFVNSTGLSSDDKKIALSLFEKGLSLIEIELDTNIPWIIKKYYLEIASLTIWADKKVEESEVAFLHELNSILGFNEDDFENSMIAVEAFVIRHWQELDYLQTKRNFEIVSERFSSRLSKIIEKNHFRMVRAIKEDPDLTYLLVKATYQELTIDEMHAVEERFLKALKSLPSFSIIELPEHFLDYRIIKKIMPEIIIKDLTAAESQE